MFVRDIQTQRPKAGSYISIVSCKVCKRIFVTIFGEKKCACNK